MSQNGRREATEERNDAEKTTERAHDHGHQVARLRMRARGLGRGKDWNKSLRERALGEHAAAEVRDHESHEEGIHAALRTEHGREQNLADEPQHP